MTGVSSIICLGAISQGDYGSIGTKLKLTPGERHVDIFILEQDQLAIGLPAKLPSNGDLCHGNVAGLPMVGSTA